MIEQPNAQDWAEVEEIFLVRGAKSTEQRVCVRGWELARYFARYRVKIRDEGNIHTTDTSRNGDGRNRNRH